MAVVRLGVRSSGEPAARRSPRPCAGSRRKPAIDRDLQRVELRPEPARRAEVGMPLSVVTPAPVSTTQGCRSRIRSARRAAHRPECTSSAPRWRASASRRRSRCASRRRTRRGSRTTPRSSSGSRWPASRTSPSTRAATGRSGSRGSRRSRPRCTSATTGAAYFDDRLTVWTRCVGLRGARFRYEYAVERDGRARRRGCDGPRDRRRATRRPPRVPQWFVDAVARAEAWRGGPASAGAVVVPGGVGSEAAASPASPWLLLRLRRHFGFGWRLRADADLAVLAPVGRVPGLVVEHLAVGVVDRPVDARGARRATPPRRRPSRPSRSVGSGMRRTGTGPVSRSVPGRSRPAARDRRRRSRP